MTKLEMNNILNDINNTIENSKKLTYVDYHEKKYGTRDVRVLKNSHKEIEASEGSDHFIEEASLNDLAFGDKSDGFKIGNNKMGGIY